ncbi:hypothetical protein CLAFUW4_13444 [Fulvia fulva]|uniref:Uncharacterized protein n=1 Tax=Passalora fulva TaxID=5499 RepID=A0A9Q8PJS7_PASFU|nr:uncharacterized protein CLAFUR5_13298 [Fulvia fulva]KAK4611838.1 hypothetical protein CLAFUR4_13447 [Fulvia fulva]KAK4612954.1 hypothetical protein CLAFUR0_13455 [Fulvia fulva]UJO23763.1 hypothetical protein CLAFUR5_13298 [Fulvia fulva]WPV21003.1 hypothetical protein CLAFUW4_13444 [Fulvia fulva]WPV36230.1 hypothetical protein CLAFUW7_13451 [Fulvia fulva]
MSQTPANTDSGLGRLGTLPGELRNEIYEYALIDDCVAFECYQPEDATIRVRPRREGANNAATGLGTFRSLCLTSSSVAVEA